ncbi:protoporphyrinogen oxidase [Thermodesulfobacteriota bacterium]
MEKLFDVIIIGAGLSGLSSSHFVNKFAPGLEVVLLEKSMRPGGAVRSFHDDGIRAEWGPHGFLDNTAESRELLEDLDLVSEAQRAPLGDFLRFVCHDGSLHPLPQKPQVLLTTSLLSLGGKLRLIADLWKKPAPDGMTISQWAEYRFGKEVLPLVDAAVTGTFAGDLDRLSIDVVMPGVRNLEKEMGSVLRGLKAKKKGQVQSGPLPAMLNFPQGMERLISSLAREKNIYFGTEALKIFNQDSAWTVNTLNETFRAKDLLIALPVNQALNLLASLDQPPVSSIPVAKIINVIMKFPASAKVPRGFGYLAPEKEHRFTMGAMFTSHMFPEKTPGGTVLIEALVGGRRHPERLDLGDDELVRRIYQDIKELMDLPDPPDYTKVLRPESGIPQMEKDHPRLLEWREQLVKKTPGLHVTGFGWDGIGMNDMIKNGRKIAHNIAHGGETDQEKAPVKPVYF